MQLSKQQTTNSTQHRSLMELQAADNTQHTTPLIDGIASSRQQTTHNTQYRSLVELQAADNRQHAIPLIDGIASSRQ
jgi:hypothetical protein